MLRHIVLFEFKEDQEAQDNKERMIAAFKALQNSIPEVLDLEMGVNNSEEGLDHGYTLGFNLRFADKSARDTYLQHAEHTKFVKTYLPYVENALVFDYEI